MESSTCSPHTLHIPSTHSEAWLGTQGYLYNIDARQTLVIVCCFGDHNRERSLSMFSQTPLLRPIVFCRWLIEAMCLEPVAMEVRCSQRVGNSACLWMISVSRSKILFEGDFQLSLSHRNSRILLRSNGQVRHLLYLVDPRNVHATL